MRSTAGGGSLDWVVDTYHRIGVPSVEHKYVSLGDRTGLGESFRGSGDDEYEVSRMASGFRYATDLAK